MASLIWVQGLQVVPHGSFTSSLVLEGAALEHAGNYTCVARNEAREAAHTAPLLVRGRTRQLLSQPAVWHLLRHRQPPPLATRT